MTDEEKAIYAILATDKDGDEGIIIMSPDGRTQWPVVCFSHQTAMTCWNIAKNSSAEDEIIRMRLVRPTDLETLDSYVPEGELQ